MRCFREGKQNTPWRLGGGRESECTWGRKQCFTGFPRFLIHIFLLMSGMEHLFLLWTLGYDTKKYKINEIICECSLKQLAISGHNYNGWSNGDIWFNSPEVWQWQEGP